MRITPFLLGAAALLMCCLAPGAGHAQAASVNVSILYTGDTHGHLRSFMFNSTKPVGGVAKRAIYFQEKRRHKNMAWLTLDAGDAITGTPLSEAFQGYLDIEAMNRLKYDGMALGIHEFDYGLDVLKQRMSEAKFPILSANVVYADTGQPFATAYTIVERNGVKIGVFGLTSSEAAYRIAPENFRGLRVDDPLETAGRMINTLQSKVDIIVALTHLGVNEDIRLASQYQQIDVIVGGMSHSELQVPMRVARTLVVHDATFGANVGQLKLSFDKNASTGDMDRRYFDCSLVPMDGKWKENTDYLAWIDGFNEQFQERLSRIVGSSSMRMNDTKVQSSETELGNFVTDILRASTGADAAILPAGFFQASLPEGPVTLGDLYAALPYDHYAELITMSGTQLQQALNDGADQIGRSGFPQVSGLSMGIFNGKAYNVRVGESELDPYGTYKVATTDMVASGGAGYPSFGAASARSYTGVRVRKLVERYLAGGTAAASRLSSRIQFLAQEPQNVPAPPEDTTAPPVSSSDISDSTDTSGDMGRLDRNGQPMNDGHVVVEDEVLTDGGGSAPPADTTATDTTATDTTASDTSSDSSVPDWNQPRTPGALLGSATTSQDGLNYTYSLYRKENGKYLFVLEVLNQTSSPIDLSFETNERFDFRISDGSNLRWNYNNNRFFVQSQQQVTIDPGESGALEYRSDEWNATDNTGAAMPHQSYLFEALFLLSGSPVQLSFEAVLD